MRVFLFPDLVFPCSLTLPEWSKCTGKLPAYWSRLRWKKFLIDSDVQPNDFVCVTVQTEKPKGLFFAYTHTHTFRCLYWDQKVNSILGVQKFSTHPVILNRLPAKFWTFLWILCCNAANRTFATTKSQLRHHICNATLFYTVKDRHTGALLTPKGIWIKQKLSHFQHVLLSLDL